MGGTRINDFVANVDIVHRAFRHVGIGASLRIPISHGFKYQFKTNNGLVEGGGMFSESEVNVADGRMKYDIKNTGSYTFFARIYFDTEINYFFDIRYNIEKYEEKYSYTPHDGAGFSKSYLGDATGNGIGFSVGVQPKLSDHFYYLYQFTVDFLSSSSQGFSHKQIDPNLFSKIKGNQTAYEVSMGIGYSF